MLNKFMHRLVGADVSTNFGRSLIEERYWSLRRQVPIVYLLGLVNLSALELAATGKLSIGFNLPSFIGICGVVRLWQWFALSKGAPPTHKLMVGRMQQTVLFAAIVCIAVCVRSLYLLHVGDTVLRMAVMLFAGLTAIGVAYGLTALPAAARIPLVLIVGPISGAALLSDDHYFAAAAFGLVTVAALTMRLLGAHSRHFSDLVHSRSVIVREQALVEQARQEAVVAAGTDFLTGLANRRAFVAALENATSAPSDPFAVAVFDLDRFKAVNDTFGHGVGDELLKDVASRLSGVVGGRGLVARLGGDELGVVLPAVASEAHALSVGTKILAAVNVRICLEGREYEISASCGIAMSGQSDDRSPSRLMANADLALYKAKADAGGGIAIFEQQMEASQSRRRDVELALRDAKVCDDLKVVFQPIFDLKSGRIIANEALARWTDINLGEVSASEFVPIAEHLDLIHDINGHLMGLAFEQARGWPDNIKLSVNLSAKQVCLPGSAEVILRAVAAGGLAARRLQFEVTETTLLGDFSRARANLEVLRMAGASIVLDDFGAGFASIGYLRELRFDQIKLDGGLVTDAAHSEDGKRLLRAVIGLCDLLGVATVAEHVETDGLLDLVRDMGCTAAQGFWLRAPMSSAELHDFLAGWQLDQRFLSTAA